MGNGQDKTQVLDAAKATLDSLPDSDLLLAELAIQLQQAAVTIAQLRTDARGVLATYRAWRREARCGCASDSNVIPLHPVYMKQLRRIWATYRLGQLLLRDMTAMANLRARQRAAGARVRLNPSDITLQPMPANDDRQMTIVQSAASEDGISYDDLEARYGPALAQRLYDEIQAQVALERARLSRH